MPHFEKAVVKIFAESDSSERIRIEEGEFQAVKLLG